MRVSSMLSFLHLLTWDGRQGMVLGLPLAPLPAKPTMKTPTLRWRLADEASSSGGSSAHRHNEID